jgi:transcriptional regulator with XRE-family HTH domain
MNKKSSDEIMFGGWVRQHRHILDLTQQELADRVGCARITLRRIESGALKPSKELAQILLEKLGAPQTESEEWLQFARGISGLPLQSTSVPPRLNSNLAAPLTTFIGRKKNSLK